MTWAFEMAVPQNLFPQDPNKQRGNHAHGVNSKVDVDGRQCGGRRNTLLVIETTALFITAAGGATITKYFGFFAQAIGPNSGRIPNDTAHGPIEVIGQIVPFQMQNLQVRNLVRKVEWQTSRQKVVG